MSVALRAEKASSEKTPNRCPSQESWLLSQPQCRVAYWCCRDHLLVAKVFKLQCCYGPS